MSDHQSGGRQWELGSRMHHGSGVGISSLKLTLIEVSEKGGRNVSRSKAENGSPDEGPRPRPPRK